MPSAFCLQYVQLPKSLAIVTVPTTRALVWWLLGFGDGVVVYEPVALREELGEIAARMAATDHFSGTQFIYNRIFRTSRRVARKSRCVLRQRALLAPQLVFLRVGLTACAPRCAIAS